MPKILAVDFDNTLFHLNSFPEDSSIRFGNRIVHRYIRRKKRQGWHIVLNTCRHDAALEYARNAEAVLTRSSTKRNFISFQRLR